MEDALNRDMRRSKERKKQDLVITTAAGIIFNRNGGKENPCKTTVKMADDAYVTVEVFYHEPYGID